jgi:hypothetical protein
MKGGTGHTIRVCPEKRVALTDEHSRPLGFPMGMTEKRHT